MRRTTATVVFTILAHAASALLASAQVTTSGVAPNPARLQLTPFGAIGDDLAPGGGLGLTYLWTPNLRLEVEGSLGIDAARSSASVLYGLPRWGCCRVYVAGGYGVQRDQDPDYFGPGTRKKTEPAVNIGAGMAIPVSNRSAYRFDFRWYNPKWEWPESWRIYNGISVDWRP